MRGAMNGDPGLASALTDEGVAQARLLGEASGEPIDLASTEFERTNADGDTRRSRGGTSRGSSSRAERHPGRRVRGGLLETSRAGRRALADRGRRAGRRDRAEQRSATAALPRGRRRARRRRSSSSRSGLPIRYLMLAAGRRGRGRLEERRVRDALAVSADRPRARTRAARALGHGPDLEVVKAPFEAWTRRQAPIVEPVRAWP